MALAAGLSGCAPDGPARSPAQEAFAREFPGHIMARTAITSEYVRWTLPGVQCRHWPTRDLAAMSYTDDFRVNRALEELAKAHNRALLAAGIFEPAWGCSSSDIYMHGPEFDETDANGLVRAGKRRQPEPPPL